jgi:cytochrome oxidase Cu insertion factor (SCO1/SenC/PrrC family)
VFVPCSSASEVAIREMAKTFEVFFQKIPQPSSDYMIDHSAVVYVLDAQTRVWLMLTATQQLEDVVPDVLELLHKMS